MSPPPTIDLAGLQTENRNPRSANIDEVTTQELCRIFNREDSKVPKAVEPCIPVIAETIDVLSGRVHKGGRVFYIGAGTSGRLGVLDASEIPPTYSAPASQFVALIAGGDHALRHAKEGSEDCRVAAEEELRALNFDPAVDSLIGIASSGRTPYVLGGLAFVRSIGGTTVGLVCVEPSAVGDEGNADHLIAVVTGPEVVTGSTRMKAGTGTKLVLNMISTGIMIKLGKTYGNLMIDVKSSNEKLKQRSRNILRFVGGPTCTDSDEELEQILAASHGSVKLAAAAIGLGVSVAEAEQRLRRNSGVLARVFREKKEQALQNGAHLDGLVLCVDAGGTSCKAVVLTVDGLVGTGVGGPCNVSNVGLEVALATISGTIQQALDSCDATKGRSLHSVKFSSAWVGIAGYDRPALTKIIETALSDMLRLPLGRQLRITTDIDMLPAAVAREPGLESVIVLVAGTGSVAMSYSMTNGDFHRTGRTGGWGYLLGDEGSGYWIGREGLRLALQCSDSHSMRQHSGAMMDHYPKLYRAVVEHFQSQYPDSKPQDLLSTVVVPDPALHQAEDATLSKTKRIAGVARVVLSLADSDQDAKRIADDGVGSLVRLVGGLIGSLQMHPASTGLVLAGGLMQDELYKSKLVKALGNRFASFKLVESVTQPALEGAKYLQHSAMSNGVHA